VRLHGETVATLASNGNRNTKWTSSFSDQRRGLRGKVSCKANDAHFEGTASLESTNQIVMTNRIVDSKKYAEKQAYGINE
jgi:hypothetical protein